MTEAEIYAALKEFAHKSTLFRTVLTRLNALNKQDKADMLQILAWRKFKDTLALALFLTNIIYAPLADESAGDAVERC